MEQAEDAYTANHNEHDEHLGRCESMQKHEGGTRGTHSAAKIHGKVLEDVRVHDNDAYERRKDTCPAHEHKCPVSRDLATMRRIKEHYERYAYITRQAGALVLEEHVAEGKERHDGEESDTAGNGEAEAITEYDTYV